MSFIQGQKAEQVIYLTKTGTPVTGVLYSSLTLRIIKQGQTSFSGVTLLTSQWVELGSGVYLLTFLPASTDTVGEFVYTLGGGSAFDNFNFLKVPVSSFTILPAQSNVLSPAPNVCVVSGQLQNISAQQSQLTRITAKPTQFPAQYNGTLISGEAIFTFPDSLGNFALALIQGSTVLIEIERAGIRAQINVPDTPTANLIDLLPAGIYNYA